MSSIVRFLSWFLVFAALTVCQLISFFGSRFFAKRSAHDSHPLSEVVITSVYSLASNAVDRGDGSEAFVLVNVESENRLETVESESGIL